MGFMTLYDVKIEFNMCVEANTREEAESIAQENASEELGIGILPPSASAREVKTLLQVDKDWRDCYPYRADGETSRTVKEILEANKP